MYRFSGIVLDQASLQISRYADVTREQMRLVDDEPQRAAVHPRDSIGKIGEEPHALGGLHPRGVDDRRRRGLADGFRDQFALAAEQREVAMVAAEHVDRQALGLAVGGEPQSPPGAGRVDDADALGGGQRRLDDAAFGRAGLAAAGLADKGDVMLERRSRELDATNATKKLSNSASCGVGFQGFAAGFSLGGVGRCAKKPK